MQLQKSFGPIANGSAVKKTLSCKKMRSDSWGPEVFHSISFWQCAQYTALQLKYTYLHTYVVCTYNVHTVITTSTQRELNRWSQFSEQKLRFFSKVKILKNAFNKKWWAYRVYTDIRQKKLGWLSSIIISLWCLKA